MSTSKFPVSRRGFVAGVMTTAITAAAPQAAQACWRRRRVAVTCQPPALPYQNRFDDELPIESARSGNNLSLSWTSRFNSIWGTFDQARLTVQWQTGDAPVTATFYGMQNNSSFPLLFTVQFRVLDSSRNVIDLGHGDGTNWSWVSAAGVPAGGYSRQVGPYSYSRWAAGFHRNWNNIAWIQGIRTVVLDPNR